MPILVELPKGKGVAEFPDGTNEEDIVRFVKRDALTDEQLDLESVADQEARSAFRQELGNQLVGNLQQAGIGVAQGMARLSQGANKLLELSVGYEPLIEQFRGASEIAGQSVRELEELAAETEGSALPRAITSGIISSAPSIAAAPIGLAASAIAGAIQQFGNYFADAEQHFIDKGASEFEAKSKALAPSLASGMITGLVTAGYGRTGIEALKNAGPEVFSSTLRNILRQAGLEGMEEFTDEVWQTVVDEVAIDPNKSPEEVLTRAFTAFSAGLAAGGVMQAAVQTGSPNTPLTNDALTESINLIPESVEPAPEFDIPPEEIPPIADALDPSVVTAPEEAPQFEPLKKGEAPATTDLSLGIVPNNTIVMREGTEESPILKTITKEKPEDLTTLNKVNSPQWNFWFGKVGAAAKSAWERMALGEFEMRESIARDVDFLVDDLMARLPKEWKPQGAEAFFDLLDGKTIEEIEAQPLGDEVKEMARRVKDRLEEVRVTIRDIKKESYQNFLEGKNRDELVDLYVANVDPEFNRETLAQRNITKEILARNIAAHFYPDTWGISDGTYIPHLFSGQWKASIQDGDTTRFVLRGETPEEVQTKLKDFVRANPEAKDFTFLIESDVNIPADITRLGDKQFFTLMESMREKLNLDKDEVRDATIGIIGRKAGKQKWWGNLKKRYGAENYERDFRKVMTAYLYGFHRWRVLSRVNRQVQPLMEKVRQEGRVNAANDLDDILQRLWGTPDKSTLEFDALLRKIPVLKDTVRPLALDRWLRSTRNIGATLLLTTPKFAVLNRLQPLQGLYPVIGEGALVRAKILQHSKAGKELLDRYGVTYDTGQFGEPGIKEKLSKLRERLTGEKANQELAFLAMFQHGLDTGMNADQAAAYAKLRGQLMTQFTPLISDTPGFMRGPVASTVFQFKRFPVKQMELLANLVRDRNVPGVARMIGAFALLGGLSFFLRSAFTDKDDRLALKKKLNESIGEDQADAVWYGLPGLANVDLSGSLMLIDEPFGDTFFEKLGRFMVGPTGGTVASLVQGLATEQREPRDVEQRALDTLRKIPMFKGLVTLSDFLRGNRDVRTSDGEVAFRRRTSDALVNLGSFQSANEANNRLAIDAFKALEEERSSLKNRLFVRVLSGGDPNGITDEIDKFNRRWPEAAINADEMVSYFKGRAKGIGKTDLDRMAGKKYRSLLPEQPE